MKQSLSRDCIFKGCAVLGGGVEDLLALWAALFHAQKMFTQRLAWYTKSDSISNCGFGTLYHIAECYEMRHQIKHHF